MIPKDGRWIFRFSTRSDWDRVDRAIKAQKFYATLPRKIDVEIEEYLKATEEAWESEWEFWEKQDGDTPLGGTMGVSHKHTSDS